MNVALSGLILADTHPVPPCAPNQDTGMNAYCVLGQFSKGHPETPGMSAYCAQSRLGCPGTLGMSTYSMQSQGCATLGYQGLGPRGSPASVFLPRAAAALSTETLGAC